MSETEGNSTSAWKGAKGVLAVLAGAAVLVGCLVALLFALSGESEADARAGCCERLTDSSATVKTYEGLDPQTAANDDAEDAPSGAVEGTGCTAS